MRPRLLPRWQFIVMCHFFDQGKTSSSQVLVRALRPLQSLPVLVLCNRRILVAVIHGTEALPQDRAAVPYDY